MRTGRLLVCALSLATSGLTPAAIPARPAQVDGSQCVFPESSLPAGVTLQAVSRIDPGEAWTSPQSVTSPQGEAVRAGFCRIEGTIDGDIGFEIWLPHQWNGRLLGAGVGGEAGYFNYADMARGVEQGFVTASSDTGHKRGEPWIIDPRKAENYAHVAYHRLTEVAKAISSAFYGQGPAYSYFIGCSGGGRQALRELQLYPGDYDGALVGAPGLDVPLLAARLLHVHLQQTRAPGARLSAEDWNLVADAAVRQCDAGDGVADGIVSDPRTCRFTVRQLACTGSNTEGCLSPEKVATAEAIIAPLTDSSGRTYDFGLLPGITVRPGGLPPLPVQMFGEVVHGDPSWDPRTFDLGQDLASARAAFPSMDARSADLRDFVGRNGKLILYHGWADASVQPLSTIDWFDQLEPNSDGFARLYMVPGMQHCRGGDGTDRFGGSEDRTPTGKPDSDLLAALVAWVENGVAPGTIAARTSGQGPASRSRPLCPYPTSIKYLGGSPDDAASFTCTSNKDVGPQNSRPRQEGSQTS